MLGHLDRSAADPAAAGVHQQRFAPLELAEPEDGLLGGQEHLDHGAAVGEAPARGHRNREAPVHARVLRVSALGHQPHDSIARLPFVHVRAYRVHLTRELEAEDVSDAGRHRILALPLDRIGAVDAGGPHPHQDVVRPGRGLGGVGDPHDLGPAVGGNRHGAHCALLARSFARAGPAQVRVAYSQIASIIRVMLALSPAYPSCGTSVSSSI